jgi:hypothetical protein
MWRGSISWSYIKVEGNEQYRDKVPNRFGALEDLAAGMNITSAWETIIENIWISAKEILLLWTEEA